MLLDKRLTLFEAALSTIGASPFESDSFDALKHGLETREDLFFHFLFKTQADTSTAFTVALVMADSADLLTNPVTVQSWALGNLTSSPAPAGTLLRAALSPAKRQIGDITPDTKRYWGFTITYTTTPNSDELAVAWIGGANDVPTGVKELS